MKNDISENLPFTDQPVVRRMLVIEDTPEFAKNALALENCKITIAGDMKAAIRLMREQQFDLVLSDLNFPTRAGEMPKGQDRAVAVHCLWNNLPVAIVTRGNPSVEEHIHSKFIVINTFTPSDLVYVLAGNGFRERHWALHRSAYENGYKVPFSLLDLADTITGELETVNQLTLHDQSVKSTTIWKKALTLLEASISARKSKEDVVKFWTRGIGKGLTVPKSGEMSGIPVPPKKAMNVSRA
jgi:CheY-like chemotaxis protein